ncbi:apelin [Choloepus didactylus]|uniref:apelin n=1 Tax=Choloepus didactylus TaxID=27675 RepID=UPI00189EF3B6|nr:apelin [Choloepus didactylus]
MNVQLCTRSLLIGFLLLTGPLMQPSDGKGLQESSICQWVQPRGSRNGPGPWQGGRRKFCRQQLRLSHKGPMPF